MLKSVGITRKLDKLNRVVIPKELCISMNLNEGDFVEIFVDEEDETILIKKFNESPSARGHMNSLRYLTGTRKNGDKCLKLLEELDKLLDDDIK